MKRSRLLIAAALAAGVVAAAHVRSPAQPAGKADDAAAGIRKNADEYTKAFNAGDAKAAALGWVADGEYTDPDGDTHRGRDAVEAELAAFLKANPKATVELKIESIRPLGRAAAVATGTATTRVPTDPTPVVSRFSGVFVEDGGAWKIATLHDWLPDPATDVTVADVAFLVGKWTAKGPAGDLSVEYALNGAKLFITGKYTVTKDGKTVTSGTQVIGTNPAGGLRGWAFDDSGATGDEAWTRDGTRWLVEAVTTLPDGGELTAVNVLVPLGPDAFTWQPTQRAANGVALPDQPPVRVTRVKTK